MTVTDRSTRERSTRTGPRLLVALASLGVSLAVVLPFLERGTGVWVYYSASVLGPITLCVLGTLILLVVVVGPFTSIRPDTVAGVALGGSVAMALVAGFWSLSVRDEVVLSISRRELFAYHRWILLGLTLVALAGAVWYVGVVWSEAARNRSPTE
ncbi:DUF7548 family protein [Haloprofundus halobius]|uniref:DUF7548 family protein n=1 Tax=Haloprofundus halobius TaxID=2876194 RepID=UPI001CCD6B44|nr:hypothetical protein [Haloprofundus halobius]